MVSRIDIGLDRVRVVVRLAALTALLRWGGIGLFRMTKLKLVRAKHLLDIVVPFHFYRQRREPRLPLEPCIEQGHVDANLTAVLDDAREAQRLFYEHRDKSLTGLAQSQGKKPALFSCLIRLNYLAPDFVAAITDGRQPKTLVADGL